VFIYFPLLPGIESLKEMVKAVEFELRIFQL